MKIQRILHIIGRMDRAGAETMLMNLYREIDRSKFQFDFIYFTTERCDYDDEIELLGGHIICIGSPNPISRFLVLLKVLKKGDWSIVHAHTLFSSGLYLLAAKLAKVPMRLAHSHNTSDANSGSIVGRSYQNVMRWLLSWVPTGYLACGTSAAEYLFPTSTNVEIIPNAIDINQFINAQGCIVRKELNIRKDKLIILQVGRLTPVKNHTYSVKIAAALRDAGVNFQMLFVGTGPEQQAIDTIISQFELEEYVLLLGLREDIPELMAASDLMLMPSLHEGFPVVLVESQAAGLPAVIASTITSEVDLDIGLVHFIDLDANPEEWVSKIRSAAQTAKVSAESRLKALESRGFSANAGAERLMTVYKTT